MLELKIKDVEINENGSCFIYCEDENRDEYRFPVNYDKARITTLLLIDAYAAQGSVYEFIINLLSEIDFWVDSLIVDSASDNRAVVNIKDSNNNTRSFCIQIPDALILSLMLNSPIYIDKKADILMIDEADRFFWYRFLRELDLC